MIPSNDVVYLETSKRMNLPEHFPIHALPGGWCVTWPEFRDIRRAESKHKLADLVFDTMGVDHAGFGIGLEGGDSEYVWIQFQDWADQSHQAHYLQDRYVITGVIFEHQSQAAKLQSILEKRLIWKRLLAQPA